MIVCSRTLNEIPHGPGSLRKIYPQIYTALCTLHGEPIPIGSAAAVVVGLPTFRRLNTRV